MTPTATPAIASAITACLVVQPHRSSASWVSSAGLKTLRWVRSEKKRPTT